MVTITAAVKCAAVESPEESSKCFHAVDSERYTYEYEQVFVFSTGGNTAMVPE